MATLAAEPPLFVKAYFSDSVEDTLDRARAELGPDALLLNERETPPETRHLGAFEVVFGVRRAGAEPAAKALISIAHQLSGNGVPYGLAVEVEAAVQARLRGQRVVQIERAGQPASIDVAAETAAEIESRFDVAPELGRISVFIGAPGAGKTTTLVKLALTRGLAQGRKVHLISTDDRRIGAAAQFRSYASILGAPCTIAGTTAALAEAIDSTPADTLVLVDTPGYTAQDVRESGRGLMDFLRQRQDIDTHLVLTASMREIVISRTVDGFLPFRPAKLLFTRLDETDALGVVFSQAARTRKPVSFFSTGPLVPEDLAPATKERVVEALVRQLPHRIQAKA